MPATGIGAARARLVVVDGLRRSAQGSLTDQAAVELLTSYALGLARPARGGLGPSVCPAGLVLA
jgi:hypothetical protein